MNFLPQLNRLTSSIAVAIAATIAQPMVSAAATLPCDIYATGGTPCVAAYSTVRVLSSSYTGPLYQVRRTSDKLTKDIGQTPEGYANAAAQDSFLGTGAGTFSKLYDQSGKGNDLTVAKKGSYIGTAAQDDKESNAKGLKISVNGHSVYAIYAYSTEGYRTKQEGYTGYPAKVTAAAGMPTGNQPQGIYMLTDGSRPNIGCCCCFDFGNASLNNAAGGTGMMNTIFFGTGYWGKGVDPGPWFLNDMENGVWAGGSGTSGTRNDKLPSSKFNFAFGISKTSTTTKGQYAIRVADATVGSGGSPKLITAYDGQAPADWNEQGSVVLGIGGDNSNSSDWTFYEGCITAGRPSDKTDTLILQNMLAARYGATTTATHPVTMNNAWSSAFKVRYNPSTANAAVSYALQEPRHISIDIFNQQGRQIAAIVNNSVPAGRHEAVWNAKQSPAGIYLCTVVADGLEMWTGKIVIGK